MRKTIGFIIVFILMLIACVQLFQSKNAHDTLQQISNAYQNSEFSLAAPQLKQTSYILDKKGRILSEFSQGENRIALDSEEIPQIVKDLFVYTEDRNFYSHKGIDYIGTARAFFTNLANKNILQGGSTITQQLARGLYLSNIKTYERKIQEIYLSIELEKKLSKEQILTLYINQIFFGNGAYGIEAASQQYFNRSVKNLSLAQTAFICAIPNNPTLYDPYTHMEHTKERQERMLKQLLDYHIIDQNTYKNACEEKIVLKNRERIEKNAAYASFVHYELQELVASQMEFDKDLTKEEKETLVVKEVEKLLTQGIKIYTAYDENAQQVAETAFHNELDSLNVQGAVVIINHQNYTIPAIIGGKNVGKFEFNRAYQGERQPGSAIKPLLVYAPYLETFQATPYDTVDANNVCFGEYCPKNYGGGEYGIVTLKTAMTYSYNTPAVRLLNETGIDTAFSYLEPFQWTHITQDDRYLSAALGAVNVTPLEITNAYTTFSHNGYYKPAHAIRKVTDADGNLLFKWSEQATRVWSMRTNDYMNEMLQNVVKNGTARQAAGLQIDNIGGKTGTTNDVKDLWMVGKGGKYTIGVWVGYDQPASMEGYINARQPQIHIWRNTLSGLTALPE